MSEPTKEMSELIERTKNWGNVKNPDGTTTIQMKLSVRGSVENCINSQGKDNWSVREVARLYHEGREAWLQGNLETVADFFGMLV